MIEKQPPPCRIHGLRGFWRTAALAYGLCAALALCLGAAAQEAPPRHWYWWLREQLQFVEVAAEAADPEDAGPQDVAGQVRELRRDVDELTATVELYLGSLLANMQEENARLRAEVQRLQATQGLVTEGVRLVPNPYDRPPRTPEDLLPEGVPDPASLMPAEDAAPEGPPGFEIIDEWGRTPEDLAKAGQDASTLKGMVVLVEPSLDRVQLETLGRQLFADHAAFDNINIEVYNDRAAAEAAAKGEPAEPRHRVLIVSKHAASNRKLMIYLGGETPATTPLE